MRRAWITAAAMAAVAAAARAADEVPPSGPCGAPAPACEAPSTGCKAPAGEDAAAAARAAWSERSAKAVTAADRHAVGIFCREKGLLEEARAEFREAVRLDPAHDASREALGERRVGDAWLPSDEAMKARGLVLHAGRWMLPEERDLLAAPSDARARFQAEERRARGLLEAAASGGERELRMAKEAIRGVDRRAAVAPLAYALRAKQAPVRLLAAGELGRAGDRRALKALVYRSLRDPDEAVRAACTDAAMAIGDADLLAPYARALRTGTSPAIRAAAADGIGRLGDARGVGILVSKLDIRGGGPRAHIYLANQLSFVQDFDVEVAQTAFIADPIVGVLQEGIVLDAQVVSAGGEVTMVERTAIGGALKRLTGQDHGDDADAWRRWMASRKAEETAAK
jgi:hypothetical protein